MTQKERRKLSKWVNLFFLTFQKNALKLMHNVKVLMDLRNVLWVIIFTCNIDSKKVCEMIQAICNGFPDSKVDDMNNLNFR